MRFNAFFSFLILFSSCGCNPPDKDLKVFKFYKNLSAVEIPNEETRLDYSFSGKMQNPFNEPIVIPFIQTHLLPIEQAFSCDVNGDSLVNIASHGTGDYFYYGLDTLYAGETQRNFVLLDEYYTRVRNSPFNMISFQYYFLKDFSNDPWNSEVAKQEFYILYKDSSSQIHIYQPMKGFNPHVNHSHPIPK
ncbi:MAG: hypothetical protein K9J37_01975 [Saprospiraceae bacterium]|nr:hypothetical protein [Saprospiraceae bacterium]MCF8248646.1 hypothetical protein [Saprospiraceae bacterium]MCF8278864.1 hypothetical protein [Bacteroidales bacterium]MCF8310664.1 hypothetical protein [Saprospiraceae bacterium]MCF8439223.1 hypothetical protein [Saprospiraceae bacterium]